MRSRWRLALLLVLAAAMYPAGGKFELRGRIVPPSKAAISLSGSTSPFHSDALADSRGRFVFRELLAGQYTVAVFIPGRGEARQTVDISPGTADARGRVDMAISVDDPRLVSSETLTANATVSARELSIPENARREFGEAQKSLARRDVAAAVAHLEKAVGIAPRYSAAWNNLGTIAYQNREYARAERDFRKALDEESGSFAPLVNLGGALLSEGKLDEALQYNRYAVLRRPNDALANSQLGLNYFALGSLELGEKYLEISKRLDPSHFSYPQLTLAQIHVRRREPRKAAEEFRDFLKHHPDAPEAGSVRAALAKLE